MVVFKKGPFPVLCQSRFIKFTSIKMLKFLIFVYLLATTYAAPEDFAQNISNKKIPSTVARPFTSATVSRRAGIFNGHLHGGQPVSKETRNGNLLDMHTLQTPREGSFGQTMLRGSRSPSNGVTNPIKAVLLKKRENLLKDLMTKKVADGSRKEGIQIGPPGAVLQRGINSFSHRSGRQLRLSDADKSNHHPQSQIFLRNSLDRKEEARTAKASDIFQASLQRQDQQDEQSSGTGKERPLRQVSGGFSGFPGTFSPVGNIGTAPFGTGVGDPLRGSFGNFGATNLGAGFVDPFRGNGVNLGAFGGGFGDQFRGNVGNLGAFGGGFGDQLRGNVGNLGAFGGGFGEQFRGNVGNLGAFGGGFGDQLRGNVGNFGTGFGDPLRGNIGNLGTAVLGGNVGNFGTGLGAPFSGNVGNLGAVTLGAGLGAPLRGNVGNLGANVGASFVDPLRGNAGNLGALSLGAGNLGASTIGAGLLDPIRGNVGNLGIQSLGAGLGDFRLQSFGGFNNAPLGTNLGGIVDPLRTNVGLSHGLLGVGAGSFNGISPAGLSNPLLANIGGSALLNHPLVGGVGGLPIGGLTGGLLGRGAIIDPFIGRLPLGDRLGLSLRGRDDSRGLIIDNFGRLTFGDRPGPSDILDQTPLGPVIEEKPLSKDSNYERTNTSGRGSSFQRTGSFVLRR